MKVERGNMKKKVSGFMALDGPVEEFFAFRLPYRIANGPISLLKRTLLKRLKRRRLQMFSLLLHFEWLKRIAPKSIQNSGGVHLIDVPIHNVQTRCTGALANIYEG
jgi:hypothetical protein|tara:strand:+ start:119 stop:436 length:318 start_codon:yes stop_codon:yes gene_type:complete